MKILNCKLLSKEEARKVDNKLRKAEYNWSLHSAGPFKEEAAFVNGEYGYVYDYGYIIKFESGVRPALYLESNVGKSFKLAGHNWINVFDNVYLCEDLIGKSIFNNLSDGNDYEGSVIQKYVLSWCKSKNIEFNTEINFEEM